MSIRPPIIQIPLWLRSYWQNGAERKGRLANVGHLLTGDMASTMIGLAVFAVTARALGVEQYGQLALIYSYVRAIEQLVSFQSWQPLIKYGAAAQEEQHEDYRVLLTFGLAIDIAAAVMAFAIAAILAVAIGPSLGISRELLLLTVGYSATLLFGIRGFPTAVMRLGGRFRLIAYSWLVSGLLRLALCGIGLATGAGLGFFVAAWGVTQALGAIIFLGLAFYELRQTKVRLAEFRSMRGIPARFPGIVRFLFGANLELTIRSTTREFDTLLVGSLSDPASAGLYHVAKRFARLTQQLGDKVQTVLYPDLARLWVRRNMAAFRRAIVETEIILALFGASVLAGAILAIEPVLYLVVGEEFVAAGPLVVVQMLAVLFVLTGAALRTALIAAGYQAQVLKTVFVATLVFHASAILLVPMVGPIGANIAHVLLGLTWIVGLGLSAHRVFGRADTIAGRTVV